MEFKDSKFGSFKSVETGRWVFQKRCWVKWALLGKKIKVDPYLTPGVRILHESEIYTEKKINPRSQKQRLIFKNLHGKGLSLVVQWLRLCLPMQGTWVRCLVGELYCKTFKMVHIKKYLEKKKNNTTTQTIKFSINSLCPPPMVGECLVHTAGGSCMCVLSHFSHVQLCDSMTVARQAPLSMGLCR